MCRFLGYLCHFKDFWLNVMLNPKVYLLGNIPVNVLINIVLFCWAFSSAKTFQLWSQIKESNEEAGVRWYQPICLDRSAVCWLCQVPPGYHALGPLHSGRCYFAPFIGEACQVFATVALPCGLWRFCSIFMLLLNCFQVRVCVLSEYCSDKRETQRQ